MEDGYPSIIMELAPDGSLYDYLQREDDDGCHDKLEIVIIRRLLSPLFKLT